MLSQARGKVLQSTGRVFSAEQSRMMGIHFPSQAAQENLEEDEPFIAANGKHGKIHDCIALVGLLKSCAKQKDLYKGSRLHAHVLKGGLLTKNIYIANALLHLYAISGALVKAEQVIDELILRDVVSWTALIAGYAHHGHGEKALDCYERMQGDGVDPNETTFLSILKACGSIGAAEKGIKIHDKISKMGLLAQNCMLGTALVDMYCKCGELAKAQVAFNELPVQDTVSWNTLIAGYSRNENGEEALACFEQMKREGLYPNELTFASILKACGSLGVPDKGSTIHFEIVKNGLLGRDTVIGTALVDMYARCGVLAKAQQVFDELPLWDAVSWNVLIARYCQHGHGREALSCFEQMKCKGFSPDILTFACILKACGTVGAAEKGREIHNEIVRLGLLKSESGNVLGNALLDMYASCGKLAKAQEVFDELRVRDVVLWNALIIGYCQHGHAKEALNCFEQMNHEGVSSNAVTLACIVKACGSIGAAEKGKNIHDEIVRKGSLEKDVVLGNALVDMYASCGALAKAQQVFEELLVRDVSSWNVLIAGYCQHGLGEETLQCFDRMKVEGLSPNPLTFSCVVKACGTIQAAEKGIEIHDDIIKKALVGENAVLQTALVDMYAKCGALSKAQQMFDELLVQSVVSWNALITGYCQHGHCKKAVDCFEQMQVKGLLPDAVTFTCILKACGSIGAAEKGKEIHAEIARHGLLGKNSILGTSLVHMYVKCGALSKAQEVLDKFSYRSVISWTSLLAGYSLVGKHDSVYESFKKMEGEGIEPNLVTFMVLLNSCSNLGILDMGQMYIEMMTSRYGIIPSTEHQIRMVELFSFAGQFDKAMEVMEKMSCLDYFSVWFALLDACQKWAHVKLGRLAFEHAVRLDSKCGMAYVCMSNMYVTAGMQEDAKKIEAMGINNGVWEARTLLLQQN